MNPQRLLPIGLQTLSEIISDGYYYVDKTGYALQLIRKGKYYFLSRPRRFGKSLLIDTFKEIFEGNQALFQGLEIHGQWDWSVAWPVIRISFGGGNLKTPQDLAQAIHKQLERHERSFGLPARYPDSRSRLADLIERLHEEKGRKAVVLVDEYDKPILDNIEDDCAVLAMREDLKDIYSVIKECDAHLRFVFLAGVSKFSKVSLFSGLNNLNDISLDARYSAICGYTDNDIDTVFAPELPGLDRAEIRRWYNGYNWRGTAVYNPCDVLFLFDKREFGIWWFQTATPTFLVKLLVARQVWLPALEQMAASAELMDCFEVGNVSVTALLFQAGYLTIKGEALQDGEVSYQLGFPNHEVVCSFHSSLLGGMTANPEAAQPVQVSAQESGILVQCVGEPKLSLAQKLALFQPEQHGGEPMASGRVGAEVF